ncbi:MAG: ZIP family metal transporter [Elusimicrobia bacterium]|nr:ZIP family metal transporter [Elusimicrobiota bacterium]
MTTLQWIVVMSAGMSAISWIGALSFFLSEDSLRKGLDPLVSLAAGTLLGGAIFHLLPEALRAIPDARRVFLHFAAGFSALLVVEQFLQWRHSQHDEPGAKAPVTYLILVADGVHNFIGGLGIGAVFVADVRLGWAAWVAAALHEIPQEMGDFGILVRGGWGPKAALWLNFASALTFPLGALLAYFFSRGIDVSFLVPFAAGNFVYISASGLIPEMRHHRDAGGAALNFSMFILGLALLFWLSGDAPS